VLTTVHQYGSVSPFQRNETKFRQIPVEPRVNRTTISREILDLEEKASEFIRYAAIPALAGSQTSCGAHKNYVTLSEKI
jgi:hypothetical protein